MCLHVRATYTSRLIPVQHLVSAEVFTQSNASATGILVEYSNDVFVKGQYLGSMVIMEIHSENIYAPEKELRYTKSSSYVCFF